jgi:hypothetical protein
MTVIMSARSSLYTKHHSWALYLPTVTGSQDKVPPLGMFANQQISICSIRTPAHRPIKKFFILELGHEPRNRFSNGHLRCVGVCICRMFGVRPRNGDHLGRSSAVGLMLFKASKAGKLITDFDYSIPMDWISMFSWPRGLRVLTR